MMWLWSFLPPFPICQDWSLLSLLSATGSGRMDTLGSEKTYAARGS